MTSQSVKCRYCLIYQFTLEHEQPVKEKPSSSRIAQCRICTGLGACASEQSLRSWTPFSSAHHRSMTGGARDDRDTGLWVCRRQILAQKVSLRWLEWARTEGLVFWQVQFHTQSVVFSLPVSWIQYGKYTHPNLGNKLLSVSFGRRADWSRKDNIRKRYILKVAG